MFGSVSLLSTKCSYLIIPEFALFEDLFRVLSIEVSDVCRYGAIICFVFSKQNSLMYVICRAQSLFN